MSAVSFNLETPSGETLEQPGNLFFLTETALYGTNEDLLADPNVDANAQFLPELTHREAIERELKVMDTTALSLCMDNDLPIYVFNMADDSNIDRIVRGERVGTLVHAGGGAR